MKPAIPEPIIIRIGFISYLRSNPKDITKIINEITLKSASTTGKDVVPKKAVKIIVNPAEAIKATTAGLMLATTS